jgi:hypothetical protein
MIGCRRCAEVGAYSIAGDGDDLSRRVTPRGAEERGVIVSAQKKRPGSRHAGTGLVVALRSGLVGPAVTNSALSSEAGGGRLRRPAGLAQVKTTSLAIELKSIKDHLLPTKDLVTQPRMPKDRSPLPSSPSRRVSATRRLHYSRTVQVSYTRITRKKFDSGKTRRAGGGSGRKAWSREHGAGRGPGNSKSHYCGCRTQVYEY